MVGHQWLPWINNPASSSISVSATKQEQEISPGCHGSRNKSSCQLIGPLVGLSTICLLLLVACVALSVLYNNESDGKPAWRSLFDYQNISDGYLAASIANAELRRNNEVLQEQSAQLQDQNQLFNRTLADLTSANVALSLESVELTEQIVNLTSTNLQLTLAYERLVRYTSEQDSKTLNLTETIEHLVSADAQREDEGRRLTQLSHLLRDELDQEKEKNQQLLETNHRYQEEVKNLSGRIGDLLNDCEATSERNLKLFKELQEQNQNLSAMLMEERQEAADREEEGSQSVMAAYESLDRYCPVVNNNTKERICRKCPDSWKLFENKCYFFSSDVSTWSSSRSWCWTQEAELLVINSRTEQNFIFESSLVVEPSGSRLWIGLTDSEEEGEWRWVDGSPVTSHEQFWLSRPGLGTEPDDWKLDDPLGEDCGHLDTSETVLQSWMDGSCETPYRWICEKDV